MWWAILARWISAVNVTIIVNLSVIVFCWENRKLDRLTKLKTLFVKRNIVLAAYRNDLHIAHVRTITLETESTPIPLEANIQYTDPSCKYWDASAQIRFYRMGKYFFLYMLYFKGREEKGKGRERGKFPRSLLFWYY